MRSLPPPRVTRKRRWMRIKRAIRSFFAKGYVTDPGAFMPTSASNRRSISTIRKSRFSPRFRKSRINRSEIGIREGANAGIATASFVGKMASRASMPVLRRHGPKNLMNLTVRF
ncbi:unnamed protein product [Debaryomyces fabryi]|nr:unnamed protein product [Debaryomyces fabryi]